ncbi:MAG: DUF2499 domain-containing protein [Synechococcus sp.]|nr:DUF2499 domain-containing protein [Synechococcus sp.]
MHALSLGTWWIHVASVLEWIVAMALLDRQATLDKQPGLRWLALAMTPALISAMAACTWHLFDNTEQLRGLVVLQAASTAVGNACMAAAAWRLLRNERSHECAEITSTEGEG